jgi:hypothetical protein
MKLTPDEIYRLRKTVLDARRKALEAQLLDLEVGLQNLELEQKYGLLDKDATINVDNGEITIREQT